MSFSFHANKNMTTGEGGCLVMNDEDEARRFEKLRLQGVTRFADGGMDVDVARRQVQPDRHRGGDRPRPAAATRRLQRTPRGTWRGCTSSASTARSDSSCRRPSS
ncbi:MAG: DegT/DnrJ/EryC1/StrS family aminotransferase [Albidovulum sp.]